MRGMAQRMINVSIRCVPVRQSVNTATPLRTTLARPRGPAKGAKDPPADRPGFRRVFRVSPEPVRWRRAHVGRGALAGPADSPRRAALDARFRERFHESTMSDVRSEQNNAGGDHGRLRRGKCAGRPERCGPGSPGARERRAAELCPPGMRATSAAQCMDARTLQPGVASRGCPWRSAAGGARVDEALTGAVPRRARMSAWPAHGRAMLNRKVKCLDALQFTKW